MLSTDAFQVSFNQNISFSFDFTFLIETTTNLTSKTT